jgi:hypothetical protein
MVPFSDSPWQDTSLAVMAPPDAKIDAQGHEVTECASLALAMESALPCISLAAAELNGTLWTFRALVLLRGAPAKTETGQVYFETTAGRLLVQRAQIDEDGFATTMIDFAGVPLGTSFKVKAGFKHFSGLAEVTHKT